MRDESDRLIPQYKRFQPSRQSVDSKAGCTWRSWFTWIPHRQIRRACGYKDTTWVNNCWICSRRSERASGHQPCVHVPWKHYPRNASWWTDEEDVWWRADGYWVSQTKRSLWPHKKRLLYEKCQNQDLTYAIVASSGDHGASTVDLHQTSPDFWQFSLSSPRIGST